MTTSPATILYVEDEQDDVFFVRRTLQRACPEANLAVVVDGSIAISYLSGDGPFSDRNVFPLPSVVLLDIGLPLLSGFDVLEWLRTDPALKKIPAIVFSTFGRPEARRKASESGATAFVAKTASGRTGFELLAATVRSHLPAPDAETPSRATA
jgi:CheY-like chemotaxis protein